jgi:hypothetical protein
MQSDVGFTPGWLLHGYPTMIAMDLVNTTFDVSIDR